MKQTKKIIVKNVSKDFFKWLRRGSTLVVLLPFLLLFSCCCFFALIILGYASGEVQFSPNFSDFSTFVDQVDCGVSAASNVANEDLLSNPSQLTECSVDFVENQFENSGRFTEEELET